MQRTSTDSSGSLSRHPGGSDGAERRTRPPRRKMTDALIMCALAMVIAAVCGLAARIVPFVLAAENLLSDLRVAYLAPPQDNAAGIVVVGIDEATLATLPYRSPVNRDLLADVVDHLSKVGVRALGVDILLDQPTEPAADARLRQAFAAAPMPVVVAVVGDGAAQTAQQKSYMSAYLDGFATGEANLLTDLSYGVVRWSGPAGTSTTTGGDARRLGFAAALAAAVGGTPPSRRYRIDFRPVGPDRAMNFPVYPAFAVNKLPADWLKDKIVLIGTVLADQDRHRTPLSVDTQVGALHGIQIHAQILAQILDGRNYPILSVEAESALLMVAALVGIAVVALPWPLLLKAVIVALLLLGYWTLAFVGIGKGLPVVALVAPSAAFVAALGVASAVIGRRQRAERRFIRQVFGQYVSPNVVDRLIADAAALKFGGERREMTFLFTDLAGFTALTEATPPETFQPLLNRYLDGMIAIALSHDGTIDKIVGDALVVFFGAPADQPDHADRAVTCAIEMDRFARRFAAEVTEEGVPLGLTRIGVHSGDATIGNFGGSRFFDYTAHGDAVNTAARLESANKQFGTRVCVSGPTLAAVATPPPRREIGDVVLKGKTEGLRLFALAPDRDEPGIDFDAYAQAFAQLDSDPSAARIAFQQLSDANDDDGLAAFQLARLAAGDSGRTIILSEK